MSETAIVMTLKKGRSAARVEGTRVAFSAHRCFALDGGKEDLACLKALGSHLETLPGLALIGSSRFLDYLLRHVPALKAHAACVIPTGDAEARAMGAGRELSACRTLPSTVKTVFLAETLEVVRARMRQAVPKGVQVVEPTVLPEIAPEVIPSRAWVPVPRHIYPLEVPEITFRKNLDLLLLDCPSRNLALMPNGLAYVSNTLKKTSVSYQIFDLDIVAYHRFHIHRLFDMGGRITLPSGKILPEDPWQAEHYDLWSGGPRNAQRGSSEVVEFFRPLIEEAVNALAETKPKILGLSIQQCNEAISREVVRGVRALLPETVIVVGGFSCYNADIGMRAFPDCDYMCIGEADLTVGHLIAALARGERPRDQPGVLSRFDTPGGRFIPAPMVHNLDQVEFPKYEWCDLSLYRNYNDYQLTPIIASRGCRWSRCTFCAERFYWRIRSAKNFVDELEWLVDQGCHLFMFNESDLNGMPEKVLEICDEIIRRGLHRKVKLTGQLRIHKKSNRAYFEKLRAANFVALRFGVDAFSENTLRLQKKGYTVDMVSQNLRDCWESGIYTEVNWVIGVPGETDEDVQEGIDLILKNRKYIGRLANINPLIMVNGGVYWIDPAAHNIVFHEPREELYAKYPRALPADTWHSTHPYIDAQVRKERFERIALALHESGFPVGAWASRIIEDVKFRRDPNRAGSGKAAPAVAAEEPEQKVALEVSSQHAPETDARGSERKAIPLPPAESGTVKEAGRPAAEPPLHGVAGEAPRLIRKLETHDVVFFNGSYYGVPHALGKVDLSDPDPSKLAGVARHATEEGVVAIIEEAARWANTRGQYDAQEKQRAAGSYYRVASALGESRIEALPEQRVIVRCQDAFIAIERQALKSAFTGPARGFFGIGAQPAASVPDQPRPADSGNGSVLRQLAKRLPPSMQQQIKRLIRMQSLKRAQSGSLVTLADRELLGMVWRGAVEMFVQKPVARLLGGAPGKTSPAALERISIDGDEYTVLSAATKNALPELMWTIEGYNLVKYDGMYYGLPHGVPVDWETEAVASIPGVVTGRTIREVMAAMEGVSKLEKQEAAHAHAPGSKAMGPAGEAHTVPQLLGSLEGHEIVSYEGWIYGIPQELGSVDLTEVDAMGLPGVIRDVSKDVVENEILDRVRLKQTAASQS